MTDKYPAFQKIPRWFRDITISEKIDGTNGLIYIYELLDGELEICAGSRNRWLTPATDNFGFAKWVEVNQESLKETLGPGHHYGEWWGAGIQRNYGLKEKRFSLFNTHRWSDLETDYGLDSVSHLYSGPLVLDGRNMIDDSLIELFMYGSHAAPGFMKPEGIVIYHQASGHSYKVTLENDEAPKNVRVAA